MRRELHGIADAASRGARERHAAGVYRAEVKGKAESIYSEYQKAVASHYAELHYQLKGPPTSGIIDCGPVSNPDHGCHAEDADASAAYLQALLWSIGGDHRYADNAIAIVNAYGHGLQGYTGSTLCCKLPGAARSGRARRSFCATAAPDGSHRMPPRSAPC